MEDNRKVLEEKLRNSKLMKYCHELVMLNYLYAQQLISKDEMLIVRKDINKKYGMKDRNDHRRYHS
jgi:hypothetical protein